MATFKELRNNYNLKPWDINRTDINSPEDKYQDAVLANLEKKATKKKKPKKKVKE